MTEILIKIEEMLIDAIAPHQIADAVQLTLGAFRELEALQRENEGLRATLKEWHFTADMAAAAPTRKEACAIVTEAYEKSPTGLAEIQAKAVEGFMDEAYIQSYFSIEADCEVVRTSDLKDIAASLCKGSSESDGGVE